MRSFSTYDRRGNPAIFEPLDALAPALLDAPLKRTEVNQMFSADLNNPYRKLKLTIDNCLTELARISEEDSELLDFGGADLEDSEGLWSLVNACYQACSATPNIKASKVSKILHRKQPTFIPIIDSKLVKFYGLSMKYPSAYWPVLQSDFRSNREFLDLLGQGLCTSEGNAISSLRVADIIIWEHVETGCLN